MKRINLILLITIWILSAVSQERWEVYTNTSHVYQTILNDSELISVSWGGIEDYELTTSQNDLSFELKDKYTSINGLSSNEVRTIYSRDNKIWAGTYNDGVTIIENGQVYIINSDNGLHSNKVKLIKSIGDLVYVVTESGFSTFYELADISFPILSRKYSEVSTSGALISGNINDLVVAQDYVYLATDSGLNYFPISSLDDFDDWQSITPTNSPLADDNIYDLAVFDNKLAVVTDSLIQIVTNFLTQPEWETYDFSDKVNGAQTISAVNFDAQGNLIFSLGVWNEDITTMSQLSPTILQMIDTEGNIIPLLTTETQVHKLSSQGNELITLAETGIKSIEVKDDMIVLSTWGAGILINNNSTWYQFEPNGIGFNAINYLTVDNDNNLWASCGYYGTAALRKGARGVSTFNGSEWTTYNMNNSPLQSDNINSITVGNDNKKWFGSWYAGEDQAQGWLGGTSSFDENTNAWRLYNNQGAFNYNKATDSFSDQVAGISGLPSQTVSFLNTDLKGNIMMSLQGYGLAFYSPSGDERLAISPLYGSQSNFTRRSFNSEYGYFFSKSAVASATESAGLLHWDSQELPQEDDTSKWTYIPVSDIRNSVINDMVEVPSPYGTQLWIAGNEGLFMYDGQYWYRYGIDIKRERWSSGWQIDTRYFVGETKLFAAKDTYPTALEVDDYGCLWIGSEEAGLTKYDTSTEEYFVYEKDLYPLISNQITALAYEPQSGKLFIGASEGLCSLTVGSSISTQTDFNKVVVVPNPFYPEQGDIVRIFNDPDVFMPNSSDVCKIFDKSGQLVYDLPRNKYQTFSWDGRNNKGKKCSSGVYFYTISNSKGETKRGKIALIRD